MSSIVFVGPTLRTEEVRSIIIDADCRPPAAQGDLYKAALARPRCIGLIDGYFDGVPSVWHKEILWAMANGVRVYGSASMGALRAAELCHFGMRGVGQIFEAYRDGILEDDDEVAVLHAPAELGFAQLSEPMVSMRRTVDAAESAGVLTASARSDLLRVAKALHYRERTWDRVLALMAGERVCPEEMARFGSWLAHGRIDAKRADALAMLREMARDAATARPAPRPDEAFAWTNVWDGLTRRVAAELVLDDDARLVLDELRLDNGRFDALRRGAALRQLATDEARRRQVSPSRRELLAEIARHREAHGLTDRGAILGWLDENALSASDYERLAHDNHLADAGGELAPDQLARHVLEQLKWSGEFGGLRRRALEKQCALAAAGYRDPVAGTRHPGQLNVLVWYFEQRLGGTIPEDLDGYARGLGLESRQELYRIIAREHLYSAMLQDRAGEAACSEPDRRPAS